MKKNQYIFIRINWLYITILHNTKTKILALSYTSVESYTPRIIEKENVRSFFLLRDLLILKYLY